MTSYRVRRATPADVPMLLEIWRRAVDATHHFLTTQDRAAIDRLVGDDYLPKADLLIATDADGAAVAFLGSTGNEIDSLFVDPPFHGQGVGRLLVETFAASIEGDLHVDVNEQNAGARAFYDRLGFRVTGRSAVDAQGRPYPLLHLSR